MKDKIIRKVEEISPLMIEKIKEIVSINSIESDAKQEAPFGEGVKEALLKALNISKELGFESVNMDSYLGYASYGKSSEYVCAIGHLDVVPVGDGWKHPPFSAYEEDGFIYSRGILDNKGPIFACLFGLYALKELGIELSKEVRIIFGCDEETGFEDLKYYLNHELPPIYGFTPDCKYPVVYAERGRAIIKVTSALDKLDEFFEFVNEYFINAKSNGENLGIDVNDKEFGETVMRNYKLKMEGNLATFRASISYPASISIDKIMSQCNIKAKTLKVELESHFNPVKFKKDCFLVKTLQNCYEEVTGLDGTPVTTTGGTYAKMMPNIVPFGPSFPGQKGIGHNPNEWMSIEDIITNAKIYALSLYELAK